jgi:hypothetical protein
MTALLDGVLVADARWGVAIRDRGGGLHMVRWPFGYSARSTPAGAVLLDGGSSIVAREGAQIQIGGGEIGDEWIACG